MEDSKTREQLKPIRERVKSFEDALLIFGVVPENQRILLSYNGTDKDMLAAKAFLKLTIIARVLNEWWLPDWSNGEQEKWFPCFDMRKCSGFRFLCSTCIYFYTYSFVSSHLCYRTEELAEYAGNQFEKEYKDLMK